MTGRRGGRIFKVEEMSRVKAVGWGRVGPVVSALGAGGRVAWASWSRSPGAECNWMLEEGKGLERAEGARLSWWRGECVCVCDSALCIGPEAPASKPDTMLFNHTRDAMELIDVAVALRRNITKTSAGKKKKAVAELPKGV